MGRASNQATNWVQKREGRKPFVILKPVDTGGPRMDLIQIYKNVTSITEIAHIFEQLKDEKVVAFDFETKGVKVGIHPEDRPVGIGLGWSTGLAYIDLETMAQDCGIVEYIWNQLAPLPIICHNMYFDGMVYYAWNKKLFGEGRHLNMLGCTLGYYMQLANEGFDGQRHGLKFAQEDLLLWTETNEFDLDNWLIDNKLVRNTSTKEKQGYYWRFGWAEDGTGRFVKPSKGEMWQAPPEILGKYCALDCDSTLQLWNFIFEPAFKKFPGIKNYHSREFLALVKELIEQTLFGIRLRSDDMTDYESWLASEMDNYEQLFRAHERVAPLVAAFEDRKMQEFLVNYPNKYRKKKIPKEPTKVTKSGTISKVWLKWDERMKAGDFEPEISKNWLRKEEKRHKIEQGELSEYKFNINSGDQRRWLLYENLFNERMSWVWDARMEANKLLFDGRVEIPLTKTGLPTCGGQALNLFEDVGELLRKHDKVKKEREYINSYLGLLIEHEEDERGTRIHPSWRIPGTLTGRLGGRAPNLQQVTKSFGTLSLFVPDPGHLFVDCYSADTEVLTRRGWDTFDSLKGEDEVWQVNPHTQHGSWVRPSRIIWKKHEGSMIKFGRLLVTPNHKMNWHNNKGVYQNTSLAGDSLKTKGKPLCLSRSRTESIHTTSEIWKALMLQADGSINKSFKSATRYRIEVKKTRKVQKVTELLGSPHFITCRNTSVWDGIKFSSSLLTESKQLDLTSLGTEHVDTALAALCFWDGTRVNKSTVRYTSRDKENIDQVSAYFCRAGYKCQAYIYHRKTHHAPAHYVDISTYPVQRVKASQKVEVPYSGMVGCVTVPEGYIMIRREGFTYVSGNCDVNSLEQVVLAELSQDPTLMKLYGPGAKPNDVYLFNAASMPVIGPPIRAAGYDPNNPTVEGILAAKKKCKRERGISKVVTLASSYGAGVKKIWQTLTLSGVDISMEEVMKIHKGYWELYSGVKRYEERLVREWEKNEGYVLNGYGRPVCVAEKYLKDIVNRVCQSTGHDCLMTYIYHWKRLMREADIPYKPIVADFHDESILQVKIEDADRTAQLLEHAAFAALNNEMGNMIPLAGEAVIATNLAELKLDAEDIPYEAEEVVQELMDSAENGGTI